MLREGIISGKYPESMDVESIYADQQEYRQYVWNNFKTNCNNLRASIAAEIGRANEDAANLAADMSLHPPNATVGEDGSIYRRWAGSDAERLLKDDVDHGRHLSLTPSQLRNSRLEYQEWPLKVFRDHITQEVRSRKTQAYWLHRTAKSSSTEPWPPIDSL